MDHIGTLCVEDVPKSALELSNDAMIEKLKMFWRASMLNKRMGKQLPLWNLSLAKSLDFHRLLRSFELFEDFFRKDPKNGLSVLAKMEGTRRELSAAVSLVNR
jgi:hypothetical protein